MTETTENLIAEALGLEVRDEINERYCAVVHELAFRGTARGDAAASDFSMEY